MSEKKHFFEKISKLCAKKWQHLIDSESMNFDVECILQRPFLVHNRSLLLGISRRALLEDYSIFREDSSKFRGWGEFTEFRWIHRASKVTVMRTISQQSTQHCSPEHHVNSSSEEEVNKHYNNNKMKSINFDDEMANLSIDKKAL